MPAKLLLLMPWLLPPIAPAADGRDAKALVAALASADPAKREAAGRGLESIGKDAVPALEAAIRGDDQPVRERATAIWESVQRALVTRPMPVRLDGTALGPAGLARAIHDQTGMTVEVGQAPQGERLGPLGAEPVPFWEALGRLGFSQAFDQNPGEGRFPKLLLHDKPAWRFTSTSGPFRVLLTGLHWHRDRTLVDGPWVRIDRFGQRIKVPRGDGSGEAVRFFGSLDVMAEPRVWLTQEAPARLIEAVDDRGRSLLPEGDDRAAARHHDGGHFAFHAGSGVTRALAEFRLRPLDRIEGVARLRGAVPLMLHVRRPAPALVIPLEDAAGKTFDGGDARFEIVSVNDSPARTAVTAIVRLDVAKADLPDNPDPELVTTRLRVIGAHQLELVDARGNVLAYSAGGGSGGGQTPSVYRWTISGNHKGKATHLRYYRMLRVRAVAEFEFRDVPLPGVEEGRSARGNLANGGVEPGRVAGVAAGSDLSDEGLIDRLGSPDRVVSEEAARTLAERGDGALVPLRAARDAAGGIDVRGRIDALIASAETARMGRATTVKLDNEDRPLGEAVAAVAAQSGYVLALDDPGLAGRRVTVRTDGPVPFFEALDRLGRAGHVRHDPGPRLDNRGDDPGASAFRLVDGDPPGFTAYGGPLRVHLFATHRHVDLGFGGRESGLPAPATPGVTAEVQAFAEPGRFIDAAGPPRLEMLDDRGRPLPGSAPGGEVPNPAERSWMIPGRFSLLQWQLPLGLPHPPPAGPIRLRCVLPVVVSARQPEPLIIPLADFAGKSFRHPGGATLTVERVAASGPRSTEVVLALAEDGRSAGRESDPPADLIRNRLEFQDEAGRALSWLLPFDPSAGQDGVVRVRASVSSPTPPSRLMVYRLRRLATEVSVVFDGIPAP